MKLLLYAGLGLAALWSLRLLAAPLRRGLRLLLHGLCGGLALVVFNVLGGLLGVTVGVNLATALTVGLLGPSGLLLLLVLRLIFVT